MNINKFVDKQYEKMTFKELKNAPIDALQGVSEKKAELILQAFRKRELTKFVNWSNAIVTLAAAEE